MNPKTPQEEKPENEEKAIPSNLLTPEEREYLAQKTKDATEIFKKLFPNGKTRGEGENPNPVSEENKVPHNFLTTSEKELLKRKMKEASETYKKLSNGRVKLRDEK